jgi:hypothetical protein
MGVKVSGFCVSILPKSILSSDAFAAIPPEGEGPFPFAPELVGEGAVSFDDTD